METLLKGGTGDLGISHSCWHACETCTPEFLLVVCHKGNLIKCVMNHENKVNKYTCILKKWIAFFAHSDWLLKLRVGSAIHL